jgi:hypothetical protein
MKHKSFSDASAIGTTEASSIGFTPVSGMNRMVHTSGVNRMVHPSGEKGEEGRFPLPFMGEG